MTPFFRLSKDYFEFAKFAGRRDELRTRRTWCVSESIRRDADDANRVNCNPAVTASTDITGVNYPTG